MPCAYSSSVNAQAFSLTPRPGGVCPTPGMQREARKLQPLMKTHWCSTGAIIWLK